MSSLSSPDPFTQIYSTFLASIRSVGTACTLAAVGIYLHRRGFIIGDGKRTLALISQQVTIPLLFFTKIMYCNQDWSDDPCPDITESLRDVWVLLLWPIYVVAVGFAVGYLAAVVSNTPQHQIRAVLVACGFGNSTGLPITLLSVVHANFPASSDLGRIDPCLFLSVYLITYPVLQWGVGGWLLAPPGKETISQKMSVKMSAQQMSKSVRQSVAHNVVNRTGKMGDIYKWSHRGIAETDASFYMSVQEDLNTYGGPPNMEDVVVVKTESMNSIGMDLSGENTVVKRNASEEQLGMDLIQEDSREEHDEYEKLFQAMKEESAPSSEHTSLVQHAQKSPETQLSPVEDNESSPSSDDEEEEESLWETTRNIVSRCLQPPVVGALLGMFVASFPRLRGIFVDLVDRNGTAPLEWFFDGLYEVGQAAVPINMVILGCNLSASYTNSTKRDDSSQKNLFSQKTTISIVIAKMFVMPMIGFLSALIFRTYIWDIPDGK
jgi:predicted permease